MGKMAATAALLGLELKERFKVRYVTEIFYFSEKDGLINSRGIPYPGLLSHLLQTDCPQIRKLFFPIAGEKFFYILPDGSVQASIASKDIHTMNLILADNCFSSEEDAIQNKPEIMHKYRTLIK